MMLIWRILATRPSSTVKLTAAGPSVLLLDEPTASLDLRYQIELVSLVARLNTERGVTVVLTLTA